jgi:S1-C subfamily serine protease
VPIDDDQGEGSHRPLPSPDDRLWRHPSEVGASMPPRAAGTTPTVPARSHRGRSLALGVMSGLLGAAAMFAVLSASGAFIEHHTSVVVEKVSSPVTPSAAEVHTVAERVLPMLARLDVTTRSGTTSTTAVVFRSDGYLLTTADAVHGAERLAVQLSDGTTLTAKLLGADAISDVAVIKVARSRLNPAVLTEESEISLGEPAIAIACVAGRPKQPDVDTGVVSALGKRTNSSTGESLLNMIQTNVPESGDGAVLVDSHGAVMGIVTAAQADLPPINPSSSTTLASERLVVRFATPIDYARAIADELIATGHADHAWLGVETSDLSSTQQAVLGQPGAKVIEVMGSSPASAAGLQAGDVLVGINGKQVTSSASLVIQLRHARAHQIVSIEYLRDGDERETQATLVDRGGS